MSSCMEIKHFSKGIFAQKQMQVPLPKLLVTGRTRHLIYMRLPEKERSGIQEVKRNNGEAQQFTYHATLPYEKWMGLSSVQIVTDLCGCGWDVLNSQIADVGEIRINELEDYVPTLAYLKPAIESKVRHQSGRAYIDFPLNSVEIDPNYHNNSKELSKITSSIDSVRNNP